MTSNGIHFDEESSDICCYEDSARSVEIVREENKDGQLGSFGFTIFQERPPRIGTVIPGGPADKAGLKKGDMVLAVNGEDISQISHKEVTSIIKSTKTQSVWLSVCESDEPNIMNSSLGTSPQKSFFQSTPVIHSGANSPTSSLKRIHQLQNTSYNGSSDMLLHQRSRGEVRRQSPPNRSKPNPMPAAEPNYVTLIPPQSYTVTRMLTLVMYCGPVKIPVSWSNRGVSSMCIQECARQLLSKRRSEDFLKVQLEVSQSSLRISNLAGSILAKHRRHELYYCGSCTNDEQYFAVVSKSEEDGPSGPVADLCHIFKLIIDSKLSTYVIDRSKSSREVRSGPPSPLKSCVEITEAIESIFQTNSHSKERSFEISSSTDNLEYGIVRGISTLQLAGTSPSGTPEHGSPMLKRKKSNVVDLRSRRSSPTIGIKGRHTRNRSISNPNDPTLIMSQRTLHPSSSAGYIPTNGGESVHLRSQSDIVISCGSTPSVRGRSNLLHSSLPREDAKRISDCSFSSMSSDHSGHRSSTSRSGSPLSTPNKSLSPTPVPPPVRKDITPNRVRLPPRKLSALARDGAISPCDANMYGSKMQLRRQGSEGSIFDLTGALQMSPYHHFGIPNRSSSVDSIVTITTLAEDDVDLVVGRVAGWCGSFDKLLSDPLGLQYFLQFLESEHSEENLLFWKDIEEYKKMAPASLANASKKIFNEYLSNTASRLINIDDIVKKNVEAKINLPTALLYDEAQKEIYLLMKMDCYPRFQKSPIIKESLLAEMEGRPLPSELTKSTQPVKQTTNQLIKKKPSILDRFKGSSSKDSNHTQQSPAIVTDPLSSEHDHPPSTSSSIHSFNSLTQSLAKGGERRRSKKEKKEVKKQNSNPEVPGYHPEDNLKHLQAHKGNLFEINLPNRITKIIEAPSKTTVREALVNILKKYNYSLDVMEVRLTSTLQTISVDSPASILIGKHVSIMKSKHTVTATFPDMLEIVLLADGSKTVRDLFNQALLQRGKTQPYSIYVDGARAPLELDMSSSVLDGHTVSVKYLPSSTLDSVTTSVPNDSYTNGEYGLEDLISEITRLSSDTLVDQRIIQEDVSKARKSPKLFHKKHKKSPQFARTKSGATVSSSIPTPIPPARSISPPPNLTGSLPHHPYFPKPPASDPPNLFQSSLTRPYRGGGQWEYNHPSYHQHQRSGDAMSGVSLGSNSSVDSITHELALDRIAANRMQLNQWIMQSQTSMVSTGGGPNFFPTALGDTLDRQHHNGSNQNTRQQAAMMNSYLKQGEQLDNVITDAYNQRPGNWQQRNAEMGNVGSMSSLHVGSGYGPNTNYPWRNAHQKLKPRHSSDQGSIISDSSSIISNTSSRASSQRQPPLSPTTHVLVVEENQSSETYV